MAIIITIGAINGDIHWRPPLATKLAPFKWRHLIHSMAILSSQSPFRVSGSFGDPMAPIDPVAPLTIMATMAIHLRQRCNGDNGANSDDGDPLVPMATMAPMTSMATMVQNLIMTAALATMVPMAIVIAIGTTFTESPFAPMEQPLSLLVSLVPLAPLSIMDRHNRHLFHCRHWHHSPHWRNWCHCRK